MDTLCNVIKLSRFNEPSSPRVKVYEAIVLALEKMDDRTLGLIIKLLVALHASVVVTPNQMKEGFIRVSGAASDQLT